MINIKTDEEIKIMRQAGQILGDLHNYLEKKIVVGITTLELDNLANEFIKTHNARPSFLKYGGFPKSICISINEEIVHGIPKNRVLEDGDVISLDMGVCYKGYHSDSAWTYVVGKSTEQKDYLLEHTLNSLLIGLKEVKPGNRVSDISKAIYNYAKKHNLGVVEELVGHGIGRKLHEKPDVPNFISNDKEIILKKGMCLAIEPMLTLGDKQIAILDDKWTIVTLDGSLAAHFEHTVVVTDDGYEILSKR